MNFFWVSGELQIKDDKIGIIIGQSGSIYGNSWWLGNVSGTSHLYKDIHTLEVESFLSHKTYCLSIGTFYTNVIYVKEGKCI